MKRKLLPFLLAFLALGTVYSAVRSLAEVELWAGVSGAFLFGDDEAEPDGDLDNSTDGYEVSAGVARVGTAEGWQRLVNDMAEGKTEIKSVELAADIDISQCGAGVDLNVPFDGKGHAIVNSAEPIFGTIGEGGSVKNLKVTPTYHTNEPNSTIYGTEAAAGMVARVNRGFISDCVIMGRMEMNLVSAFSYVDAEARLIAAGGVVGENYGTVERCYTGSQIRIMALEADLDNGVCPRRIYVGAIAGYNKGVVNDCFVDCADRIGNSLGVSPILTYVEESYGGQGGRDLYVSCWDTTAGAPTSSEQIDIRFGIPVGFDEGKVSSIFCPREMLDDAGDGYENMWGWGAGSVTLYNGGTSGISAEGRFIIDDAAIQPLKSDFPRHSELAFSDPSLWTFNHSYYTSDTTSRGYGNFRAPVPTMGRAHDFGPLKVQDGVASVSTVSQWNRLSDALDVADVKTIDILADLSRDTVSIDGSMQTIVSAYPIRGEMNATLEGNAHTLNFNYYPSDGSKPILPPVEEIGKSGVVRNLRLSSNADGVNTPCFGLLATKNYGSIDNCIVGGTLKASVSDILSQYLGEDDEVALGGIVGMNHGSITSTSARGVLIDVESGTTAYFCPSAIYIGCLAGTSDGELKNSILDIRTGENYWFSYETPLKLTWSENGLSVEDTTFTGSEIPFVVSYAVGRNTGNMSNVYCSYGTYDVNDRSYTYRDGVNDGAVISAGSAKGTLSWAEDKDVMPSIAVEMPGRLDLIDLFGEAGAKKWGFDRLLTTNAGFRSPLPLMGVDPTARFDNLRIKDGVAHVASMDEWFELCLAQDEGAEFDGVEIESDIDMTDLASKNENNVSVSLARLTGTLNGNGHRIYNFDGGLIGRIEEEGAVRNLILQGPDWLFILPQTSSFGFVATQNYGSIGNCEVSAKIDIGYETAISHGLDVKYGGLVAVNHGSISNCGVGAAWHGNDNGLESGRQMSSTEFIRSFHLAGLVADNHGTISDCYIRSANSSSLFDLSEAICFPNFTGTEVAAPDLKIGYMVASSDGKEERVLCAPNLTEGADVGLSFSVVVGGDSLKYGFEESDWCERDKNLIVTTNYVKDWGDGEYEEWENWAADENLFKFSDPTLWTFNVPRDDMQEASRYPMQNMNSRVVELETDEAKKSVIVEVTDSASLKGFLGIAGDPRNSFYENAIVNFNDSISLQPISLNLDTLSDLNIGKALELMPSIKMFNGSMNADNVNNFAMRSAGLIDNVGVAGQVNNFILSDALIYIDPTDEKYYTSEDGDTVYVSLMARNNEGRLHNIGIGGAVIVDEDKISELGGKYVAVCLVGENDGDDLRGFLYLDEPKTTGSNKKCIAIKQNLCTGRNKKTKSTKVALRKEPGNKDLATGVDFDSPRFQQAECLFSDEEFRNGTVAYWLNHSGPGFTGDYTAEWKQGKLYPVGSKGKKSALYRVDVEIVGKSAVTEMPQFANGGSDVTVKYSTKPLKITVGGVPVALGDKEATFVYEAGAKVVIDFSPTALDEREADGGLTVSADGGRLTFGGGDGKVKSVFDARGVLVAQTDAEAITLSQTGLLIVRCGDEAVKVLMK